MDETLPSGMAVRLSMLTLSDAGEHLAGEDDDLARWLSGGRGNGATVEAYLRRCVEQWRDGGPVHGFGIRVGGPPVLAGTIEVQWDQPYLRPRQVNLAYGLYPRWRGKGLATRAVDLACEHALANGATEAIIRVDPRNQPSLAVARRCGFAYLHTRDTDDGPLQWWTRGLDHPRPLPAGLHLDGLVLLVGPPGAGKSTFARSVVQRGLAERNAIVSADQIAAIMFAHLPTSDIRDPLVFAEVDRRVSDRLRANRPAIVDATNVLPEARARLITIARRNNQPVTALRFTADPAAVLAQNQARAKRLPQDMVRAYIAAMDEQASTPRLRAEGITVIGDVPHVTSTHQAG